MDDRLKFLVLASAALSIGVVFGQQIQSDTTRNPLAADPVAAAAGRQLLHWNVPGSHVWA
jgi:hypothetical protein